MKEKENCPWLVCECLWSFCSLLYCWGMAIWNLLYNNRQYPDYLETKISKVLLIWKMIRPHQGFVIQLVLYSCLYHEWSKFSTMLQTDFIVIQQKCHSFRANSVSHDRDALTKLYSTNQQRKSLKGPHVSLVEQWQDVEEGFARIKKYPY